MSADLTDHAGSAPVVATEVLVRGAVFDVCRDTIALGDGQVARDIVRTRGGVVVVALDDDDRVLLVQQYRHAVAARLWELPAGLLDVPGESPLVAAARELAEEGDVRARHWAPLLHLATSPGFADERLTTYVARGIEPVPAAQRHTREAEEAEMVLRWVPLDDAVEAVLTGGIGNGPAAVALLAAAAARATGWAHLTWVDTP